MKIPDWIRSRREALGLSQADLCRVLDMAQPNLSRMESGRTIPSIDTIRRLCVTLGDYVVTAEDLEQDGDISD